VKRFDIRLHLKPVLFSLGGLLVVNLLLLFLVTQPRLEGARNADETTAELAAAVELEDKRVDDLEERVQAMRDSRDALERFFTEDLATKRERLVAVQREIHQIATTFQVEAAQLKFSHEPVEGTNLVHLSVNIPLSGGYNNLRQFISKVEHSELFLIIESVQLQEGEQGGSMLNLNVRLATYFATEKLDHLRAGAKSS
jgi:Tfp pilus assembly protein PilO